MTITKLTPRTWQEIVTAVLDMQKDGCYYQKLLKKTTASNSEVWLVKRLLEEKGMIAIVPKQNGVKAITLTRLGYALAISLRAADECLKQGKIASWMVPLIEEEMKFAKWGVKNEV